MALHRFPTARCAAAALLLIVGCETTPDALSPVRGKVYYKGAALHSGSIVFTPDAQRGTSGALAHGDIQSDGSYTLKTGDAPGAVPGWHRVTVVAVEAASPSATGDPYVVPRSLLPAKYRDPELSGLSCEVKRHHENQIDLHLD